MYSYGQPGSFNSAVIMNKEAHMIYGNTNNETGSSQAVGVAITRKQVENFCLVVSLLQKKRKEKKRKHIF